MFSLFCVFSNYFYLEKKQMHFIIYGLIKNKVTRNIQQYKIRFISTLCAYFFFKYFSKNIYLNKSDSFFNPS